MKTIVLFLFGITLSSVPTITPDPTYTLSQALEETTVTLSVQGNAASTHYEKPILLTLKNQLAKPIRITLPNGQIFKANDSLVQDIVITKEELIALKPHETKTLPVYGMCIEPNLSGFNEEVSYRLAGMADEKLQKLTTEIEARKDFNTLGQHAVWALVETADLTGINGFDEAEALHLQSYVADLMDLQVPERNPNDYRQNYRDNSLIKRAAKGSFKFTFHQERAVTIALFDEANILVRELYNNPQQQPGNETLQFAFDMEVYRDKIYYIRMIVDGEIKINLTMQPKGS